MSLIDKSIQIMDYLSLSGKEVSITELSKRLSYPKSTVHRILKNLLKHSLVEQEKETSKYRLGLRLLEYANSFFKSFDLKQIAKPILKKVCSDTGETTFLTVWRNDKGICIDSIFSSRNINTNLFVEVGREMPFYCTASSKIILANQSTEDIKRIIYKKPMKKFTPKTIINPKRLEKHLNEIKENGFAICDEELEEGIKAISAPIKNINGKTKASITITGLAKRITPSNTKKLIKIVSNSAKEISEMLGYNKFIEK